MQGKAPLFPIQPLPPRAGTGRVYFINVREEMDEDGAPVFRIFNHDTPAGPRLYKGTSGPGGKTINWPFSDWAWLRPETRETASEVALKLQDYLNKIEAK